MFVKRKDWEELNNKVNVLNKYIEDARLRFQYERENNCRNLYEDHSSSRVYISGIGSITLEELAECVINHKPIVRDKTIKVEYRNEG